MAAPFVAAIAERRLIERLLERTAMSSATAVPLPELRWSEQRRLGRLRKAGVVLQTDSGHYYLDGPALVRHWRNQRRRAALLTGLVMIAILAIELLALGK